MPRQHRPTLHFSEDGSRSICGIVSPSNWMTVDGSEGNALEDSRFCGNCQNVQKMRESKERPGPGIPHDVVVEQLASRSPKFRAEFERRRKLIDRRAAARRT